MYEDLGTTYKVFSKANTIVHTNNITYFYFQNPNSIVHKKYSSRRLDGYYFALEELDYIENNYKKSISAAEYRLVYECLSILNDMPFSEKERKLIFDKLIDYRSLVLRDENLSTKQKLLCISSYFGQVGIKIAFGVKNLLKRYIPIIMHN